MRLQTKYNLQTARKNKETISWMENIRRAAAVL